MKLSIFSTVAVIAMSTSALAGNTVEPITPSAPIAPVTPTAAPSNDWTGFYTGLSYEVGELDNTFSTFDLDGIGFHAGYLYDLGSVVLGGELDITANEFETSISDDFFGGGIASFGADFTRLKGIAGYDLGRFLPYVTVGLSTIDLEFIGDDSSIVYGVGASYQVSNSFRIGAEYLTQEIEDFDDTSIDLTTNTFSLRGSYNF